jgi:hypothetical protein
VARVALEVVDSSWWKQQLRVKSAGSGTTALSWNEGASRQPLFAFAFLCQPGFHSSPCTFVKIIFSLSLVARGRPMHAEEFWRSKLLGGVYDVFDGSNLSSRFPMATG